MNDRQCDCDTGQARKHVNGDILSSKVVVVYARVNVVPVAELWRLALGVWLITGFLDVVPVSSLVALRASFLGVSGGLEWL